MALEIAASDSACHLPIQCAPWNSIGNGRSGISDLGVMPVRYWRRTAAGRPSRHRCAYWL